MPDDPLVEDLSGDPIAVAIDQVEAAFLEIARRLIPEPAPGAHDAIRKGAYLVGAILNQLATLDSRLKQHAENPHICAENLETFDSQLGRARETLWGIQSVGYRQRRALWIIEAAGAHPHYKHRLGRAILVTEIILRAGGSVAAGRHDIAAELAGRVLEVWVTSGGRENAKKWDLVQSLLLEFGLHAASPSALKAAWKQERAEYAKKKLGRSKIPG